MAHLPNLGRLPLQQPTGVFGDETADVDWEERANLRRFKYEYAEALDDPDEALQTTLLTWAHAYNDDDPNLLRFAWTFFVEGGLYEILVRFPQDYPFNAPYYYIKTFGEVPVGIKEYLHYVARLRGGDTLAYVDSIFATDLNATHNWTHRAHITDYVKRIIKDPILAPLLAEAATHHVDS